MKVKTVAFACGMGLAAAGAISEHAAAGHYYIGVQGGLAFLSSTDFTGNGEAMTPRGGGGGGVAPPKLALNGSNFTFNDSSDFDPGWGVGVSVGYGFTNGFRLEGEVGYRRNGINSFTDSSGTTFSVDGHMSSWDFMGNIYYDIPTGSRWTPYIGGGIGVAIVHLSAQASLTSPTAALSWDDSDAVFAYQGIAGIGYQITESVNLGVEYRHLGTADPTFSGPSGTFIGNTLSNATTSGSYQSNDVFLKLRINLD